MISSREQGQGHRSLAGQKGHQNSNSNSSEIEEEQEELNNEEIIQSLTKNYGTDDAETRALLGKTLANIRENIGEGICLICIEDIGRKEAIWSCGTCYCVLHLVCIQRWARDSIDNVKAKAKEKGFNLPILFCCPKCRNENSEAEFPAAYYCFCGKVKNPEADTWNAPHSCGDICGRALKPFCGHSCLLLCHSGPCPPCPKQITSSCSCGQSSPKTLRCYAKLWTCSNTCSKPLAKCGHQCPLECHPGDCPPCQVPLTLHCSCSSPKEIVVLCSSAESLLQEKGLSCGAKCGKKLSCDFDLHKCQRECHEGACGPCERSCPCGKSRVPCNSGSSEDSVELIIGTCEDQCDKLLDCGNHFCSQKCHVGPCGSCLQEVTKRCKCASFEKEVLCSKEFSCQNKCKKMRDCGVHYCNKKCCPGDDCPPCRNVCGKTLSCKNHKCEAICHIGPCYPCPVSAVMKCRCGGTTRSVPCGSERKAKPPECHLPCAKPPKCDHPKIQAHRCHFGDCPRCKISCGKDLACGHQCPVSCHTLKLRNNNSVKQNKEIDPPKSKPCPPCKVQVPSSCPSHSKFGFKVLCSLKDVPCRELCDKILPCGEHRCTKPCHLDISSDCGRCEESCSKPRPPGCKHECPLGCHEGRCPECTLVAKIKCHCGVEELLVQCWRGNRLSDAEKSCKAQCPQKLPCNHRCLSLCHSGVCPQPDKCRRKVKVTCRCKFLKRDLDCFLVPEDKFMECDPLQCPPLEKEKEKDSAVVTPNPEKKKRTRKKKKGGETGGDDLGNDGEVVPAEETETSPRPKSAFWTNLKAIGIIAVSAVVTGVVLKNYGEYIIPQEYRHTSQ